jgi:hypothetical protein
MKTTVPHKKSTFLYTSDVAAHATSAELFPGAFSQAAVFSLFSHQLFSN